MCATASCTDTGPLASGTPSGADTEMTVPGSSGWLNVSTTSLGRCATAESDAGSLDRSASRLDAFAAVAASTPPHTTVSTTTEAARSAAVLNRRVMADDDSACGGIVNETPAPCATCAPLVPVLRAGIGVPDQTT